MTAAAAEAEAAVTEMTVAVAMTVAQATAVAAVAAAANLHPLAVIWMTKSRSDLTGKVPVRRLGDADTSDALSLYRELTKGPKDVPPDAFAAVLKHSGTFVYGAEFENRIVSMVTLHILPNVTWGGRPYALIENVVTSEAHRGKGIARQVMQAAIDAAWTADCYKIMLLTSQARGARGFYEAVGFNDQNKYGMIIRRN